MTHYLVVARDSKKILDRYYNNPQTYPMLTDFEHDRRQFILRFPYYLKESKLFC